MAAVKASSVLLWASIPCTGGSSWQHLNARFPNGRKLIAAHKLLFRQIWTAFEQVATECLRCGGHVAIEWPRACSYWREDAVTSFVSKHGFSRVTFDGCALGLVSNRTGLPIKKPWAVLTSCPQLVSALQVFVCPGPVVHSTHQPCAGSETKATEGYTPKLASIVHDVFRALLPRHRALVALPALLRC